MSPTAGCVIAGIITTISLAVITGSMLLPETVIICKGPVGILVIKIGKSIKRINTLTRVSIVFMSF
jgi:hypothetical protein